MLNLFNSSAGDGPEKEPLIKCILCPCLISQPTRTREILKGESSIVRIDHSASKMNFEKGINYRGHSAADELGNLIISFTT